MPPLSRRPRTSSPVAPSSGIDRGIAPREVRSASPPGFFAITASTRWAWFSASCERTVPRSSTSPRYWARSPTAAAPSAAIVMIAQSARSLVLRADEEAPEPPLPPLAASVERNQAPGAEGPEDIPPSIPASGRPADRQSGTMTRGTDSTQRPPLLATYCGRPSASVGSSLHRRSGADSGEGYSGPVRACWTANLISWVLFSRPSFFRIRAR